MQMANCHPIAKAVLITDITQEITFCLYVIRYLKYHPIFKQKTLCALRLTLFDKRRRARIAYGGTLMEEELYDVGKKLLNLNQLA